MRDTLYQLSGLALATLILSGCASSPFGGGNPSPDQLINQANQQQGQEADQSRLKAADILAQQGNNAQATQLLKQINARSLSDQDKGQYATLLAENLYITGDAQSALTTTNILNTHIPLSDEQKQRLEAVRGSAYGKLGQHQQAAETLIQAQRDSHNSTDYNDAIWQELSQLNSAQLQKLPDPDALADGWITLTQLHMQAGSDVEGYRAQVNNWRTAYPEHPASQKLPDNLTSVTNSQAQNITRIAILLPQSGGLSTVAQAIRQGIETQQQVLTTSGQSAPSIDFIDSSTGDIDALYRQAQASGAQVVIGPLDKPTVTQLEQRNDLPLPTLALNYGNSATNNNSNLYEFGLSAEDEARQAAQRAQTDGHHSANILVPSNAWGQRILNAFSQEWQSEGNEVASVTNYDPNSPVTGTVSQMLHSGASADMVFMFGLPAYARQVPPAMTYYHSQLPIYATSHVYSGTPNASTDSDLNGISFPDIPWSLPQILGTSMPEAQAYQQLTTQNQLPPSELKLAAMGVDALEAARQLTMYQINANTQIQGATGTLKIDQNRRFQRLLPWAIFRNGVPSAQ